MKYKPLTVKEQMVGLLTGSWPADAKGSAVDIVARLTVKRGDVRAYLDENPEAAEAYIKRCAGTRPPKGLHDVVVIWTDGGIYRVAWMVDGEPVGVQSFLNVSHAVTEHVCAGAGIRA